MAFGLYFLHIVFDVLYVYILNYILLCFVVFPCVNTLIRVQKRSEGLTIVMFLRYCSIVEPSLKLTTEGCFCPDGMKRIKKKSNICVNKCGKFDHFRCYMNKQKFFCLKCSVGNLHLATFQVSLSPDGSPVPH